MGTVIKFGGREKFKIIDVPTRGDAISFPDGSIVHNALNETATSNSVIRFHPGYTGSDPRVCGDWTELMAAISASVGPPTIHFDNEDIGPSYVYTIPTGSWDFRGATLWAPYNTGMGYTTIKIQNGATINNLARVAGCMKLSMGNNTPNSVSLGWTDNQNVGPSGNWPALSFDEWTAIEQSGSQPGIIVDPATCAGVTIDFKWHSWFIYTSGSHAVYVKSGGNFEFAMSSEGYPAYADIPMLIQAQDNTTYVWVGNGQRFDNPGVVFSGVPSASLYYDRLHGDCLSTSEAAVMIPNIALQRGDWYYNTTLHKPLFWDGAAWRDTAGNLI